MGKGHPANPTVDNKTYRVPCGLTCHIMKQKYILVEANSPTQLVEKVNKLIDDGYKPLAAFQAVKYITDNIIRFRLFQPMVKR